MRRRQKLDCGWLRAVFVLPGALAVALHFVRPTMHGAEGTITLDGGAAELVVSEAGEDIVRVQVLPLDQEGRVLEPPPSNVLVAFPEREVWRTRELTGPREIAVGSLRVAVSGDPLRVAVHRGDGTLVQQLTFADGVVRFDTAAPVFGLGEGARQFDRRGGLFPMEPTWGEQRRPYRGSVVPSPFLIGTEGWAMLVHQPEGGFDLREPRAVFTPRVSNGDGPDAPPPGIDLFVIALREPADALAAYVHLTGRPALPPKWALGYMQSHRTLASPDVPLAIARTFREKQLPCDALIYLGTGYCPSGWDTGHGSFEFNPVAFDRPAEQLEELHRLHFKVALHVNRAPEGLFGVSVDEASDSPRHLRNYWARHRDVFALGVDGWWPDDGDDLPRDARLIRHQLYYEGALRDRPDVRPWSLHRTGYAGSQRYGGWIWSGDTDSRWSILALEVPLALNHGLSLTPFWGSDIGGFFPTPELTGELYVRWFQFSAFCSSFRSHGRTWHLRLPWGWNTGEFGPKEVAEEDHPDPAELHNAAIEPICRQYLELRYRLLPYNYTVAREAVDTGLPMMRALWLHFPDDPEAVGIGDEYLWGRDLLVAPVVEQGAGVRRIYLPRGAWRDWWTGELLTGGRWIERPVDLATLPLFARAGAIIPLDPVRQHVDEDLEGPTTLRVFPGADGDFTLYDDDGRSMDYRDDDDPAARWIRFHWDDEARTLRIEPDPRMPRWPGGAREFVVDVVGGDHPPQRIAFRGRHVNVAF